MYETIHNYDARLKTVLRKLDRSRNISKRNKKLILTFMDSCSLENLSKARVIKYGYYMTRLSEWLGIDWEKANRKDIEKLVLKINESEYAEQSKKEYKTCIKKFYKWLLNSEDYPDIVRWIKPHSKRISKVRLPEEILDKNDVLSMIRSSMSVRDKAFVGCLWESGCRIGEFLFLRIKHVKPAGNYGLQIRVDGKTGPRRILLVEMAPYLREWINAHPFNDEPDAYVWVTKGRGIVRYASVKTILKQISRRAGIKKKVNPHAFRHSRATYLANHMTESQMKMFFGWTQASDMAATYVHLSGRDVDNAILKMYEIDIEENTTKERKGPKKCSHCGRMNALPMKFCSGCGWALDEKAATQAIKEGAKKEEEIHKIMEKVFDDPEVKEMIARKLRLSDV